MKCTQDQNCLLTPNSRSYLNRWVQPDSIIPDPYSPLDYDHYSYVRNNPVNFNDPSGHCFGPPTTNGPDSKCWIEYFSITSKYSNIALDSAFSLDELFEIASSLNAVLKAFNDDMGAFQNGLGKFGISHFIPGWNGGITPLYFILLGDNVFTKTPLGPNALIIHEIGHIFDFSGNQTDPTKYKSQEFINSFNTNSCKPGIVGCINRVNAYKKDVGLQYSLLNWASGGNGYNEWDPKGYPSDYGKVSSIEDYADSFARYVLKSSGSTIPNSLPNDPAREAIILKNILATQTNMAP
jgi:RHS repeat-associated protein